MMVTSDSPTYVVSIVMLGNSGVGKTALMNEFIGKKSDPHPTIGVECGCRTVSVRGMNLRLRIMDTCGQERFKAIPPQYYRKAAGILLVYDVTNRRDFSGLDVWIDKIRDIAGANVTIMVVGNKKDLDGYRAVSHDEGRAFATRKSVSFIETAAMDEHSVEDAFTNMSIEICDKIDRHLLRNESHGITLLEPSKGKEYSSLQIQAPKPSSCCLY
ncbi:MAG: small rab-related GTPase [Linnemannia gamsii]|nr:MAG: small rab-related GTPase [Linnemannia gamsii]